MKHFKYWFAKYIILIIFLVSTTASAQDYFTFSIVPQQVASKTARQWGPLLKYLEQHTGYHFKLVTTKNIPTFEQGLSKGIYDFAYMNPYHYTVFHEQQGYQAVVKARDRIIKGILVVKKDSSVNDIHDLDGQTLVFPSPAAFAATLLPRSYFKKEGISIKPLYVNSHDSVYLNVMRGLYPAGGGIFRTLYAMPKTIQDNLRILWISSGYTPHAIAVHPRVPVAVVDAVRTALQSLGQNDVERKLLLDLNVKGWIEAKDGDWNDVRALDLKALE